jgi:hypothetical protein
VHRDSLWNGALEDLLGLAALKSGCAYFEPRNQALHLGKLNDLSANGLELELRG